MSYMSSCHLHFRNNSSYGHWLAVKLFLLLARADKYLLGPSLMGRSFFLSFIQFKLPQFMHRRISSNILNSPHFKNILVSSFYEGLL